MFTVNVVIFAGGKFREYVGKTFYVGKFSQYNFLHKNQERWCFHITHFVRSLRQELSVRAKTFDLVTLTLTFDLLELWKKKTYPKT